MCKGLTVGSPRSAEMQAKKEMGNCGNYMLNALPVSEDIHYCFHYYVS